MEQKRIKLLDSFRFLAIISVIFFHYTYSWTTPNSDHNLYPYGSFYGSTFKYGYLGVEFFFIISGFVISYTLENTAGAAAFFKNRFVRLFPPIACWSVITLLTCLLLDSNNVFPNAHKLKNLPFSITFINPEIVTAVFKTRFDWLNGSYWSLWVEVQFYVLAAILYYLNKGTFLRNMLATSLLLFLINFIPEHFLQPIHINQIPAGTVGFFHKAQYINSLFNLSHYICFFASGVFFHHLYKGGRLNFVTVSCSVLIFIGQLSVSFALEVKLFFLFMLLLFALMIYNRKLLFFLDNPFFIRIGMISYSIYLVHEDIGILLINKFGGYLGRWSPISPILVCAFLILAAELSYRFIEQRAARILKRWLSGGLQTPPQASSRQSPAEEGFAKMHEVRS
jgi:peptidoglycan/LPS O-acetylase OafA/YrhL